MGSDPTGATGDATGDGRLAGFVEVGARAQGYAETASDALIDNVVSHQAHAAAG